ncbi:MAG: hypothetical protein RL885_26510 [Planctomycetota bacterium]
MIATEISGIAKTNQVFCWVRVGSGTEQQSEADWKGFEVLAFALRGDPLPDFLRSAVQLEHEGRIDASIDAVTFEIDKLLRAGQLDTIDELLLDLPVPQLSIQILLAILAVTLPAKSRLPSRSGFFRRTRERIIEQADDSELLDGLD